MDLRSIDGKTEVGVVNIEVGTTGTAPPNPNTTTPPPTDKDNEQLYFILMSFLNTITITTDQYIILNITF